MSRATSCSTRRQLGIRTVRAWGKLVASPAPSSSSTWSSTMVETLGKRCRALQHRAKHSWGSAEHFGRDAKHYGRSVEHFWRDAEHAKSGAGRFCSGGDHSRTGVEHSRGGANTSCSVADHSKTEAEHSYSVAEHYRRCDSVGWTTSSVAQDPQDWLIDCSMTQSFCLSVLRNHPHSR